jgi:uncharacterized membrane protein
MAMWILTLVLVVAGTILLFALVGIGAYVMSRRSQRPADDVPPADQSTEAKVDTLRDFHSRGQMTTHQYETMEDAVRKSEPTQSEQQTEDQDYKEAAG